MTCPSAVDTLSEVPDWQHVHDEACARGEHSYRDPSTGYHVFTRIGLLARGRCCGAGCRHCPYDHENVEDRPARIQQPAFLHHASSSRNVTGRDVVFWSGGKDSFLALRAFLRDEIAQGHTPELLRARVALLTTFDASSRVIAHQDIPIQEVAHQARALDLDLVGVPLHAGDDYPQRVGAGLRCLTERNGPIETLVFGDLHLDHIRAYRERELARFASRLAFPLWGVDPEVLMGDLEASTVPCTISAAPGPSPEAAPSVLEVGQPFDRQALAQARAAGWDPFGENGEFHSLARIWDAADPSAVLPA